MEKRFYLQNLDCANCANKIENALKQLASVSAVSCNAINKLLIITTTDENIKTEVIKIVQKYEPDVIVKEQKEAVTTSFKKTIIQIIGGCLFLALALISDFYLNSVVAFIFYLSSYITLVFFIIINAIKKGRRGLVLDETFLMGVATIAAMIIQEYIEAIAVILFYLIGEILQTIATNNAKNSIAKLLNICPDTVNILKNNTIYPTSPEQVAVGDIIVVKAGERIGLDGQVVAGEALLDCKSLTGESALINKTVGDNVLSGSINQDGLLHIKVEKIFTQSLASKIVSLVEEAAKQKAPSENSIATFAKIYTPLVVIGAFLLGTIPFFFGQNWLPRALVFLVISCPCAIVISVPLTYFCAIGRGASEKILIKGSSYIAALAKADYFVFDKTGTLTKGNFAISAIQLFDSNQEELLLAAAYAQHFSTHPIAKAITAQAPAIDPKKIANFTQIAGKGVRVEVDNKIISAGNAKLLSSLNITCPPVTAIGTIVYIAVDNKALGAIIINDEIKNNSKYLIKKLNKARKEVAILTGDNSAIANNVADQLAISNVFSDLLPDQKLMVLETFIKEKKQVAYIGDGINDAPALARASVGIAIGTSGIDVAMESADIILQDEDPAILLKAIHLARFCKLVVFENIFFALAIKFLFLFLGTLNIVNMGIAIFADVGVSLLTCLNAMRLLKRKIAK